MGTQTLPQRMRRHKQIFEHGECVFSYIIHIPTQLLSPMSPAFHVLQAWRLTLFSTYASLLYSYWTMSFDASPKSQKSLSSILRKDPRVIRSTVIKMGERPEELIGSSSLFSSIFLLTSNAHEPTLSHLFHPPSLPLPPTYWPRLVSQLPSFPPTDLGASGPGRRERTLAPPATASLNTYEYPSAAFPIPPVALPSSPFFQHYNNALSDSSSQGYAGSSQGYVGSSQGYASGGATTGAATLPPSLRMGGGAGRVGMGVGAEFSGSVSGGGMGRRV